VKLLCTLPVLLVVFPLLAVAVEPAIVKTEFLYETAPFASCHASTIVEANGGELLAAFFGGTREKNPDVCIYVCRFTGGQWTAPAEVANGMQPDGTRYPCWNPVLFQPQEGLWMLFWKVGPDPTGWWGMFCTSGDGGKTWTEPRRLPDGILGPIKNKPVLVPGGGMLCPSSTETGAGHRLWRVHFERSSDLGQTWTKVGPALSPAGTVIGAIQPSILLHPGGRLQAVGRTQQGKLFESWSGDGGQSWSELGLMALPNPNSGIDAVSLRDGRQLLVYNHTSKGRSPLNVAVSRDGQQWQAALVLESEPGEFSYPAVIQTKDGLVHITYTWKRQRIRHVVVDPAKLTPVAMPQGEWPK
jgi:predicted neuraminidase